MEDLNNLPGATAEQIQLLGESLFLDNTIEQLLLGALAIVVGWILARLLNVILSRYVTRLTKKTKTELDDYTVEVIQGMTTFVVLFVSFLYATRILTLTEAIDSFITKMVIIALSIKITASFLKIFDFVEEHYLVPYAKKSNILDRTIIPTLNRIFKFLVWAIIILMIISNLGYDVTSLIAGLGIGGLAIALAAQDALSNLFGSVSIFADKTFKIGDYVKTKDFEATVKSVGLRSTRFESPEGTEIIAPNKQLANDIVENLSRRPKRRIDLKINVTYDTSAAQLKKAMKILKDIVAANKATDKHCRVYFGEFADWGLVINLTYWIKDIDIEEGQKTQNDINLKIRSEFEKAKIEMAYPTQTLYVRQNGGASKRATTPEKTVAKK